MFIAVFAVLGLLFAGLSWLSDKAEGGKAQAAAQPIVIQMPAQAIQPLPKSN
jgi:hypothetical protein